MTSNKTKRNIRKIVLIYTIVCSLLLNTVTFAGTGTVNATRVNVRTGAGTSTKVVGQKNTGDKVNIISKEGDWYKIQLDNNQIAYIYSIYVTEDPVVTTNSVAEQTPAVAQLNTTTESNTATVTQTNTTVETPNAANNEALDKGTTNGTEAKTEDESIYGQVTVTNLNLRTEPSTKAQIIGKLNTGDKVTIIKEEGDWYFVTTKDNKNGYVYRDYVMKLNNYSDVSELRKEMVEFAMQFLGNPYVYGGNSLTKGVDCSGFTSQVYKNFGYTLNRSSSAQINNGVRITADELQPGDLVFYGYNGKISHVAMYIGDGKIIHANTSSTGICINGLYDKGNKPFIGCVRVLP